MKYIFVAGAPGSKWSSVVKNIYYSPSIDQSDYRDEWTYYHDASGQMDLMHLGAYFDPGMVCDIPEYLDEITPDQAELLFDMPFRTGSQGVRIIKSHVFCYERNIQYLRTHWPDCHIVLVHRSDDSCLGWWVKCGHFGITYPDYHGYYKNLRTMSEIIQRQNRDLIKTWHNNAGQQPQTNRLLASVLRIECPPLQYVQDYHMNDIKVKII